MPQNRLLPDAAFNLALTWHAGALRKADGLPYIIHPVAVARMLVKYGFSDEAIAAGYCHDLLEETDCPPQTIAQICGKKVLEIVEAVTNDESLEWEEKKLRYIETVRAGPPESKAVCVCDKIHNLESLIRAHQEQGPGVWQKFNRGKELKLWYERQVSKMLEESWDHQLIKVHRQLVKEVEGLEG